MQRLESTVTITFVSRHLLQLIPITDHVDIRVFRHLARRNDGNPIPDEF